MWRILGAVAAATIAVSIHAAAAAEGTFRVTVSPTQITISRAALNPRTDPPRTHPSATIIATVTPPRGYAGVVSLGIVDTSFHHGLGIGWYPGYVSCLGGMISARSSPPWRQTIRFSPPASPTPLGEHRCRIVINNPRGGDVGEAALTVTVVNP